MPVPLKDMHMSEKWGNEQQRAVLLEVCDDQKANDTVCTDIPWDGAGLTMAKRKDEQLGWGLPTQPEIHPTVAQLVEAMWSLVYTAVLKSKEKYESNSTQSKQAAATLEFTETLTPAGARLKKVISKRFKLMDGVEYFEVHKGE